MLQKGKSIILTCTAGRTGTGFLQKALALFPEVLSLHEPEAPPLQGTLRAALRNPEVGKRVWQEKIAWFNHRPEQIYFESSHLNNKGYIEPLVDMGIIPSLIILRRTPRDVALSLLELETVPARTKLGEKFLLRPDDPGVLSLKEWEKMSDYQLCFWYVLETERRSQHCKKVLTERGAVVVETSLEDLVRKSDEFSRVAKELSLSLSDKVEKDFEALRLQKVNHRDTDKKKCGLSPDQLTAEENILFAAIGNDAVSLQKQMISAI